jgi:RNA polymerase sigma-70 factor (ECF subfamily)
MTHYHPHEPVAQTSKSAKGEFQIAAHKSERNQLGTAPRGPAAAFDGLWQAYSTKVFRTTYRITRNREDAEDALQDAFLKAYVHLHDFDGRSSFLTWLTRIAINSALMILRKRRSAVEVSIDDSQDRYGDSTSLEVPDGSPTPEAQYAQREQETMLRDSISALPSVTRTALQLRKLEERSLGETATTMGLSLNAAKTRIYRAKASLRASLRVRMARPGRDANKLSYGS